MISIYKDLLDALTGTDKVGELFDSEPPKPVLPLIIDQYHVKEPKTLFGHVEEPQGHCARPHHQANELSSMINNPMKRQ